MQCLIFWLNRQGITQKVTINDKEVFNWKMYGFPFSNLTNIKYSAKNVTSLPALYKGTFTLTELGDTYLDMHAFGKGFVFLNGHNLGKYWQIGPQQTIYVPAGWLKKGLNQVIVFDALKGAHKTLNALPNPILNQLQKQ
jgi:beta-galactosidase